MPLFIAKLATADGKHVERRLNARNSDEARRYFRDDGYFVFSIKRASVFLGSDKRVPLQDFLLFNRELAGLIRAGLPIVDGLGILLNKMESSGLKNMVTQIRERLIRGASLSEAFHDFQHLVPAYYPTLLHAGEQSGQLVNVLEKFINQEERKRKAIKKFRQALTYPIILLSVALVALYVILGMAMPEFTALYRGTDQELPLLTQYVITFSEALAANLPYILVGGLALLILAGVLSTQLFFQIMMEHVLFRTPVLGSIWSLHNQNSAITSLRLLLQGGLPMAQALKTLAGAVPSRLLGRQLELVWNDVLCGAELSQSLDDHVPFDPRVVEMVRIGETSGTLDEMLEHLMVYGEERLDDQLEWISGMVAPLLLLIVGGFIALLVLAMYLPMFRVTDLLTR